MASAVYSEAQVHNNPSDRRPLSLCVEAPPSSSPFPSPSSSFLPPPMPGAHEFAVKPPPQGRNSRKISLVPKEEELDSTLRAPSPHINGNQPNGTLQAGEAVTPTTPMPSAMQRQQQQQRPATNGHTSLQPLPSPTTPNTPETPLPAPQRRSVSSNLPSTPTTPSIHIPPSPRTSTGPGTGITLDTSSPSLTSTRPAPPSPAVSRRVSAAPSTTSVRSKSSLSSRPSSAAPSRTNSTRKPHSTTGNAGAGSSSSSSSPTINRLSAQLGLGMTPHHPPSPASPRPASGFSFVPPASGHAVGTTPIGAAAPIKIRDFAFADTDERHVGLGAQVPRANRVSRLNRALQGTRRISGEVESSEDETEEEEEDDDDIGGGWMGFRKGMERFSMAGVGGYGSGSGSGAASFPSRMDLDRNFGGDEDEDEDDVDEFFDFDPDAGEGEDGEDGEEEPLYPGLYRALYAFEPEGTAEMALVEDQVVRVVGRGGGVGWAVVVDERGSHTTGKAGEGDTETQEEGEVRHALVPESYLEVLRLDWEDEAVIGEA